MKDTFEIVWKILILWALLTIASAIKANAEPADLKCVTIKFKNDSELKLKTQWFVNACDTLRRKRPTYIYASGETHLKQIQEHLFPPAISIDTLGQNYYKLYLGDEIIVSSITCRTLLFPPDIRKEPTTKRRYNDDGSWNSIVITGEIDDDGWRKSILIPVCDTIPGEALLWYEEVSP